MDGNNMHFEMSQMFTDVQCLKDIERIEFTRSERFRNRCCIVSLRHVWFGEAATLRLIDWWSCRGSSMTLRRGERYVGRLTGPQPTCLVTRHTFDWTRWLVFYHAPRFYPTMQGFMPRLSGLHIVSFVEKVHSNSGRSPLRTDPQ